MEKTINIETDDFKNNLVKLINDCQLPAVNIYMVLEQITNNVKVIYENQLRQERNQYNQSLEENSKGNNN